MSKIIIPLDGSERSEMAIDIGLSLAKVCEGEIVLLGCWSDDASRESERGRALSESLARGKSRVEATWNKTKILEREGSPAQVILEVASPDSFIAMTSHGRSDLKRLLFGSVAQEVVAHSCCPVLLIGPGVESTGWSLEKFMVPLDGSSEAESSLAIARSLADRAGTTIDLVQAVIVPVGSDNMPYETAASKAERKTALEYLDSKVAEIGDGATRHIVAGVPSAALIDYVSAHDVGLVVMSTHGRSGWSSLVFGSVAFDVMREVQCPVLLVNSVTSRAEAK